MIELTFTYGGKRIRFTATEEAMGRLFTVWAGEPVKFMNGSTSETSFIHMDNVEDITFRVVGQAPNSAVVVNDWRI